MSNRTRSWRKFDYSYGITLSASQLSTAYGEYNPGKASTGCIRQWWFEKVHRLPKPAFKRYVIGEVLHEAGERFFEGRDNLWPDGWDCDLDFADSGLVQCLIEDAIDKQVLVRKGNEKIEEAIQLIVLPDKAASIIGYIDIERPTAIEDNKTAKSEKWTKKPDELKKEIQLLIYGCALAKKRPAVSSVILRHNYFIKDPREPKTFSVETTVTRAELDKFWHNFIVPVARELLDLKRSRTPLENWQTVPKAELQSTCERRYGGCAFQNICNGSMTPKEYIEKTEKENAEL